MYTRIELERALTLAIGKAMLRSGLDGDTANGANDDLNDPIRYSIQEAGGRVLQAGAVTDADLLTVPDPLMNQLLDVARLQALNAALDNFADNTIQVVDFKDDSNAFRAGLEARIARLEKLCRDKYGVGIAPAILGTVDLGFAQTDDRITPWGGY